MNDERKTRVLLVDDHEMVRVGLRVMLSRFPGVEWVGEAATVAEAIARVGEVGPDVVLLDVRLGEESGFTACREIRRRYPEVRVLILTSYSDEDAVFRAMESGAHAFVLKEIGGEALLRAIEGVRQGQAILDPVAVRVLSRPQAVPGGGGGSNLDRLTPQERRILALVAEGKTNKEIAGVMGLSEKTVKNYFSHTLDRLGLARRSQAAAYYIRHQYS